MNKRVRDPSQRDPSQCLRGFAAGSLERIKLRDCYKADEFGCRLDIDSFTGQVKQQLSKTTITQLGEGTFAKVIKMKRIERRAQAKDGDMRGLGIKLRKDGTTILKGRESSEMKAIQTLFGDGSGGWKVVVGLQSNWIKLMKDGTNLHLLTVADYTVQDFMLKRGRANMETMNELEVDEISHQLLRGLAYIHSIGMVHGDISANNVLITCHQDGKVAAWSDFGSARKVNSSCSIEFYPGSQPWYSREMLLKRFTTENLLPDCNQSDEVWAIGVIVENLRTKRHPFMTAGDQSMFSLFVKLSIFLGAADLKAENVAQNWRELADVLPKFHKCPMGSEPEDMSTAFSTQLVQSCLRTEVEGRASNAVELMEEMAIKKMI